jgi:hypothetical protein
MTRRRLTRGELLARLPRTFRPKLAPDQLLDLALAHAVNLDAIASRTAPASILWDVVGGTLTWHRVSVLLGLGVDEMAVQLEVSTRLAERWAATGVVSWDGLDYDLARRGLEVMDELARVVDRHTAIAAVLWSEAELARLEAQATGQALPESVPA